MIWKATAKCGFGYAASDTAMYAVARYDPTGNIYSTYKQNVPPPI